MDSGDLAGVEGIPSIPCARPEPARLLCRVEVELTRPGIYAVEAHEGVPVVDGLPGEVLVIPCCNGRAVVIMWDGPPPSAPSG